MTASCSSLEIGDKVQWWCTPLKKYLVRRVEHYSFSRSGANQVLIRDHRNRPFYCDESDVERIDAV